MAGAPSLLPTAGIPLLSTGQAARLLGVSQHTVIRACHDGHLVPDEVTPGGHRRFAADRITRLAPLPGQLVGTGGAARALGLSAERLRRAVSHGTVTPAAITPGGHRRFATAGLTSNGAHSNGNSGPRSEANGLSNAS
jgi:excisionase family DNA binding protein